MTIFEAVVPLLNRGYVHGIIAEVRLNLLDGLSLNITKLFAKFDAIFLVDAFLHFA